MPRNYVVTSSSNETGQGKPTTISPEITKLIFAKSIDTSSDSYKLMFFQLDSELNENIINEIDAHDYSFEGFVEGGKAFILAKHEDGETTAYFYSKIEKGSALKAINEEEARWILAEPEGRLSPDQKKMIDFSRAQDGGGEYFSFQQGGGKEKLLSYYYPPGNTDVSVDTVLWLDNENIASKEEFNGETAEIKKMNISTGAKESLIKISDTNSNSGVQIWPVDSENILISAFGNAGQTFSSPDGKNILTVPSDVTQSRSELYTFSLKEKQLK